MVPRDGAAYAWSIPQPLLTLLHTNLVKEPVKEVLAFYSDSLLLNKRRVLCCIRPHQI